MLIHLKSNIPRDHQSYPDSSNMDIAWWVRVNSLNIVRRIFNKEKMSSSLFQSRLENLFIGRNKSKCWKSAYSISHFAQNYLFPFQGSGNEIRLEQIRREKQNSGEFRNSLKIERFLCNPRKQLQCLLTMKM